MNGTEANIFLSETVTYGFMILNGLLVAALALFLWRKGYFKGLDKVELETLLPEDERGDL